jgi:hypothetical protein
MRDALRVSGSRRGKGVNGYPAEISRKQTNRALTFSYTGVSRPPDPAPPSPAASAQVAGGKDEAKDTGYRMAGRPKDAKPAHGR